MKFIGTRLKLFTVLVNGLIGSLKRLVLFGNGCIKVKSSINNG